MKYLGFSLLSTDDFTALEAEMQLHSGAISNSHVTTASFVR